MLLSASEVSERRSSEPGSVEGRQDTTLEGVVEDLVFESPDSAFRVVKLEVAGEPVPLVARGDMGGVRVGETLRLRGRFTTHPRFGRQFQATGVSLVPPSSAQGTVRYLGSGLVKGVRERTARKIVEALGPDALDKIAKDPSVLARVPGLGRGKADLLAAHLKSRREEADVLSFLQGLDVGPATARRILRRFSTETVKVVQSDPYRLAEEVAGVGFLRADRLARAQGVTADDPRRAAAAVLHAITKATEEGHCFLPPAEAVDRAAALDVGPATATEAIPRLVDRGLLVEEAGALYASRLYEAELDVARSLAALARPRVVSAAALEQADRIGAELSAAQRGAVRATLERGLTVLTGGPGTGKTTTLRAVVRLWGALGKRVLLAAPTGRAAKRMCEATGAPAQTIHRLLEWIPGAAAFRRNAGYPLDADLIVVDEASMLDVVLAAQLLDAIPPSTSLLLVGDADQLPPVGPGSVLGDVIASGAARVVALSEIFRQASQSGIVQNAHRVNHGEMLWPTKDPKADFHFIQVDEPPRTVRIVQTLVQERIPKAFGLHPVRDVQVLCPMNRGDVGTVRLNEVLQAALNPKGEAGPRGLRVGDKVMQLRNDYDKDVFNGDLGLVRAVKGAELYVEVDGREVIYDLDDVDDLALAYASTIHKAQGSEFPGVVVALSTQHYVLLGRNLLYTAITRARRLCVVVGSVRAVRRAITTVGTGVRHTRLAARLRSASVG
jgi:exodeoxyribonuclease V alpha subunit